MICLEGSESEGMPSVQAKGVLGGLRAGEVLFARVREGAVLPSKKAEDAGYDVFACFGRRMVGGGEEPECVEEGCLRIPAGGTSLVPTGIASACPPEYYFQLQERGSTGVAGMSLRAGVVDSGFRGEWFVAVTNLTGRGMAVYDPARVGVESLQAEGLFAYPSSKAVCQAVLLPVPRVSVREVSYDALCEVESERACGSLGSTNAGPRANSNGALRR